jgi:hypothetical protein
VYVYILQKTNLSYLFEIRICFDKNLTLTDCDGIKGPAELTTAIKTNCPLNKTIIYPGIRSPEYEKPTYTNRDPGYHQHSWLLKALQITQFLQWMAIKIYPTFL